MLPYKSKRVLIKVGDEKVGVVEGFFTEFIKLGGVEPNYKSDVGRHVRGGISIPFNLRRWMYIDPNKKRLLFDLWKNKTPFTLHFGLHDGGYEDFDNDSEFSVSNCVAYRWRPITGAADDIVAEEIVGEGINSSWLNPCPCEGDEEMIINGDFETGDLTGWVNGGAGITSTYECSGSYAAGFGVNDYIEQTLSTPVPIACIEEFSLYVRYGGCFSASYEIVVTYSDDTTTTISSGAPSSCSKLDILSNLDEGKSVSKIKITCTAASSAILVIDDVTLICNGGSY